jgi:histidyl-tRNA synthetase
MGLERLVILLSELHQGDQAGRVDAYLVAVGEQAGLQAIQLAEKLRDALPNLRLLTHCGGGSFKSQFKKADKSGARFALVLSDQEIEKQVVSVKPLRKTDGKQVEVGEAELVKFLEAKLGAIE